MTKTLTEDQAIAAAVADRLLGKKKYQCHECGFATDDIDKLNQITDFAQRVGAGDIMPAGECPDCGALVDAHASDIFALPLIHALRGMGYTVTEPCP